MRVEICISKEKVKAMPKGAIEALRSEMTKRLECLYPDAEVTVKAASNDGLTLYRAVDKDGARKNVESILQNTWESADDWFHS